MDIAKGLAKGLTNLGFTQEVDFWVRDYADGKGPQLIKWLSKSPQPTQAVIAAAAAEAETADTRKANDAAINTTRDRRIAEQFSFGGVAYRLDDKSQANMAAMGTLARFAVAKGAASGNLRWADQDNDFGWIASDNAITPMDAQTMVALSEAAMLWVFRNILAARAAKDDAL